MQKYMIEPPLLKPGDEVRIIATARFVEKDLINRTVNFLESYSLKVSLGKNLLGRFHQFSGTISERVSDLQQAIDDPKVSAVWIARGGYGTVSLLDYIDFKNIIRYPKWMIGYSDITGLHTHLNNLGLASLHAVMPIHLNDSEYSEGFNGMMNWLFGESLCYNLVNLSQHSEANIQSSVIGGNLSVLYSVLGSSTKPNTEKKILFLEDLDEYLYHVHRMILNLSRNGLFRPVSAIILGGMTNLRDNPIPFGFSPEDSLLEIIGESGIPVFAGLKSGHIAPNHPIPFGTPASINSDKITFDHIKL